MGRSYRVFCEYGLCPGQDQVLLVHGLPQRVAGAADLHALAARLGVGPHAFESRLQLVDLLLKHCDLFLLACDPISLKSPTETAIVRTRRTRRIVPVGLRGFRTRLRRVDDLLVLWSSLPVL